MEGIARPIRVTAHASWGLASALDGFPPNVEGLCYRKRRMSEPCTSQAENVREWGALCADTITVVAEWINEQDGRCVPYRTLSRRGECPAYSVRGRFMRRTTQRCARHLYGVVGGAQVGRAHRAAVFLSRKVSDAAPWHPNHIRKCVLVLLRA
jgi:hypothetical protein